MGIWIRRTGGWKSGLWMGEGLGVENDNIDSFMAHSRHLRYRKDREKHFESNRPAWTSSSPAHSASLPRDDYLRSLVRRQSNQSQYHNRHKRIHQHKARTTTPCKPYSR